MKILIAISSKAYSGETLSVGMKVSKAFNASTTIVDVGEKINQFSMKEVDMVQERMDSWDIDRPGVDVLEWAFEFLAEKELIKTNTIEAGFPKNTLVETGGGRSEVFLEGTFCEDLNLILRNGDIVEELKNEVQSYGYDVIIIGGSGKGRMSHDLTQYINSSIFVVNNYKSNEDYRLLLPVDNSQGTRKAVKYGVRIAQAFDVEVDIITVSKTGEFKDEYKSAANWASKFLRRSNIKHQNIFLKGKPSELIVKEAGDNHIIVMGSSKRNPLKTFFQGNKPLKILENSQCPILIVK
jgi:nucleotide-binding universal stress UspA family protein|tara:strand:- start:110 stop:994 length:885 start_codon:yes stop_codon:yes gene_type:complete